ncbi:hypothetical protein BSKO_05980 [Bryopsis sp. KO-2023]|nr:hypothetical protein BSKO_05980 [Bryopsis sp. KO-2023]
MSLQEGPVLPAPSDDPFWSTFRVNPYSRVYLGSLEGQKKYESLWHSLRSVFDQTVLEVPSKESPFLRWELRADAEWHEPTWEHPRIEQGDELCLVRRDFIVDEEARGGSRKRNEKRREGASGVFCGSGDASGSSDETASDVNLVTTTTTSSSSSLDALDPASLLLVAEKLAETDLVGMGRLRCTCRTLQDVCEVPTRGDVGEPSAPVVISPTPRYNPLVSFSAAYVAEIPVKGGQLYAGTFLLPVRASDFPAFQNWFSSALSESMLDGACRLLCRYMPNCFEFVSGCGLSPHAIDCFHTMDAMYVNDPPTVDCVSYVYCYGPRIDDGARLSLWLT